MKILPALAVLSLLAVGCPKDAGSQPVAQSTVPTFGTAVGSSFQGADQNNPATTADRSNGPR